MCIYSMYINVFRFSVRRMTMKLNYDAALVSQICNEVTNNLTYAENVLAAMRMMGAEYFDEMFKGAHYIMRQANASNRYNALILDSIEHAAWAKFLRHYDFYNYFNDTRDYTNAVRQYQFADVSKFDYYTDCNRLVPFSANAALAFYNEYLAINAAKQKAWFNAFLWYCRATQFKSKMSFRRYDTYNNGGVIVRLIVAMEAVYGREVNTDDIWLTMRRSPQIGVEIAIYDGITIEKCLNGNATIRIAKDIVTSLNKVARQ